MRSVVRFSSFVVGLLLAAGANAQEPAGPREEAVHTTWERKPTAVRAVLGLLGSPVGIVGVEVERSVAAPFAIHVGIGAGGKGLQTAAGASWRPLRGDRWAIGPAASLSFGPYAELGSWGDESSQRPSEGAVLWTNLELFAALRFHNGVDLRFAAGASIDAACWGPQCQRPYSYSRGHGLGSGDSTLGYTTVAIGHAW